MSVRARMVQLGGVATRADLLRVTSRADVDRALRCGEVVADQRGRYALPDADLAVAAAHRLSGTLELTSAALHHGWEVKHVPEQPHVIVPRGRHQPLSSAPARRRALGPRPGRREDAPGRCRGER